MTSLARKRTRYVYTVLFMLLLSLVLIRCTANAPPAGGVSGNDNSGRPKPGDNPPVADPGDNQAVTAGAAVTLDGSGSLDPDGDAITFSWGQTLGTPVSLSSTSDPIVTFTAPANGTTLRFDLTVSDGQASSVDGVTVSVQPVDPSAQVIEDTQPSVADTPDVTGKFPDGWAIPDLPPVEQKIGKGAPGWIDQVQGGPAEEVELAPGETHRVELEVTGISILMGSAKWSGTTDLLSVTLSLDDADLLTGEAYSIGVDRGGSVLTFVTAGGGRAALTLTNTSNTSVKTRTVLATLPLE